MQKPKQSFISVIQDECLWENKFFVHRINGKSKALFLRNWIRSGVNKLSDLQFIDGELNMNFMHDRIVYRSHIFLEILIVREVLLPYKEYLKNVDKLPNVRVVSRKPKTSREFYVVFKNMNTGPVVTNCLKRYAENDCGLVFHKKKLSGRYDGNSESEDQLQGRQSRRRKDMKHSQKRSCMANLKEMKEIRSAESWMWLQRGTLRRETESLI